MVTGKLLKHLLLAACGPDIHSTVDTKQKKRMVGPKPENNMVPQDEKTWLGRSRKQQMVTA
jgi:hypothetical protein